MYTRFIRNVIQFQYNIRQPNDIILVWSQWDDVVAKQAELEEERRAAATVNAQRRSLISQETEETEQHHRKLQKRLEDSLSELRQRTLPKCNKGFMIWLQF